jgi:hypothetical protein
VPSAVAQVTFTSRPLAGARLTVNFIVPGSSAVASLIDSFELLSSFLIVPVPSATFSSVVPVVSISTLSVSSSSSRRSPFTLIVIGTFVTAPAAVDELAGKFFEPDWIS